jgi:hypothetical protein
MFFLLKRVTDEDFCLWIWILNHLSAPYCSSIFGTIIQSLNLPNCQAH